MTVDLEELVCALNKELDTISYVIGHDFQQPLRTIKNLSEMILEKDADLDTLRTVIRAADWMHELIQSLLDFRKLSINNPKEVNTHEVLELVLNNLNFKIKEENAGIIIHSTLPVVFIDEFHLYSLFQNLVENALKYRREAALLIEISCVARQDDYFFTIEDNGLGIEKGNQEKIFGIFKRFCSIENGTGIGLAECKRIIDSINGSIWVESVLGVGSEFNFTIPYKK